jgi:hypothetical protein
MTWMKQVGTALLVSLLVLYLLTPVAWAQSARPTAPEEVTSAHATAAGFANVVYVPSKLGFCILSGASWFGTLFFSGGTAYNTATNVIRAGCGGNWVLHGEDIKLRPNMYSDSTR